MMRATSSTSKATAVGSGPAASSARTAADSALRRC
ncbi:hypothetical protein PR003_g16705 [Phytophthora rubi]|uniref:Uncharacterized protein n=1 Tax=Phytophthora rubi TaxID=129364 RepID=A0A6A3KIT1_9STRA|nr:hypothetical protein PR002_g16431 [Phytophthora rubi]KAE9324550.1 hypothetical protein PR003_g16705 [Phytophthora rubi]